MTNEQLNILSASPLFIDINPAEIEGMIESFHYQITAWDKGTIIAQSGTPCNHIRIILKGIVAAEMMDISGKILKIEDMEPSKLIAPAFLYGRRRQFPVNVIANVYTEIWQMHRDDFSRLMQKEIRLLDNYLNAISNRAQFLSEKIRFLSFPTLKAKLAFFILQYSGGQEQFKFPMTHQQLSELFGVARPSLSREIRIMNVDGLIASERETIRILDPQRLKKLFSEV